MMAKSGSHLRLLCIVVSGHIYKRCWKLKGQSSRLRQSFRVTQNIDTQVAIEFDNDSVDLLLLPGEERSRKEPRADDVSDV